MRQDWEKPETWIRPRRIVRATALRSSISTDVQLVCDAGPYSLDMLVRDLPEADHLEFSGLVQLAGDSQEPVSGLPVTLLQGSPPAICLTAETDEFGDFCLIGRRSVPCGLTFGDGEDTSTVLVWEGVQ